MMCFSLPSLTSRRVWETPISVIPTIDSSFDNTINM